MPTPSASDPSPLIQTAVYMLGMAGGYALLTSRRDWQRAWQTVRTIWERSRP
jgi:hypothetical protein